MNSVLVESTENSVSVEPTIDSIEIETFDVWTDYYFLHMAQVTGVHREAGAHEPEGDS